MFVEPTYAASPEYREFWENLRRGEFQADEFKRIGKGGKEVWIQASYNPILDLNGKPFKVVKFATDVTAAVSCVKRSRRPPSAKPRTRRRCSRRSTRCSAWSPRRPPAT